MKLNRREFLMLTAAAAFTGCHSTPDDSGTSGPDRIVNAGPAANYAVDGVYGAFRNSGFFLVRRGGRLFALSATCTHKKCRLQMEADRSFSCPCHGSTFSADGHVTEGPARRDLPVFATVTNPAGDLLVTIPGH